MPFNTLADDLQRLVDATDAIGQAIIDAGGTVNEYDRLEEYPADIMSINRNTTSIDITENGQYYAGEENTITTTSFPITIRNSVGTPMKHVTVDGNMQQNGTPTPQSPIQPNETGERTGNLVNVEEFVEGLVNGYDGSITTNANYITSDYIWFKAGVYTMSMINGYTGSGTTTNRIATYNDQKVYKNCVIDITDTRPEYPQYMFNLNEDCYLRIGVRKTDTELMLNTGSTPLQYEPYGYKLPISNCGKNLWNEDYTGISSSAIYKAINVGDGNFTLSSNAPLYNNETAVLFLLAGNVTSGISTPTNGVSVNQSKTVSSINGYVTIAYRTQGPINPDNYNTMLNYGSTPLPYEPRNRITAPIYFGEVPTTRQIKELILTGGENWGNIGTNKIFNLQNLPVPATAYANQICSHFPLSNSWSSVTATDNTFAITTTDNQLVIHYSSATSITDFKQWLATQYAAGTPVTVWYVLAEPTTGIVNEPLRKIGNYVDTVSADITLPLSSIEPNIVDVNTSLKPSSASFTYNKKNEYIGYDEINVDVPNTYTVEDEGKVVNNATLVAQTAMPTEITANDTYDTTLYNSIVVNVPPTPPFVEVIRYNDNHQPTDIIINNKPDDSLTWMYLSSNIKSIEFKSTPTSLSQNFFTSATSLETVYVPWSENEVAGYPWGAPNTTHFVYDYPNISASRTINYENDTTSTTGSVSNLRAYNMIGRCNVSDDGTITAYYGDTSYTEDGSNGQVMVYIPKFYYKVNITDKQLVDSTKPEYGYDIHEATYSISDIQLDGYKLHPAFINADGDEVEYVLCSAFEGSTYDTSASAYNTNDAQTVDFTATTGDLLASIGYVDNSGTTVHVKPASGLTQNLTRPNSMKIAKNRGTGWYALTFKLASAIQMLITVEYGCNSQVNIANGVVGITDNTSYNCASYVGSTVGNTTGRAASTINEINGTETTYTSATTTSVNWRGIENMWGNIWKWVDGINIYGNGSQRGGVPYVCTDMNFSDTNTANYESVGFTVANTDGYVKYFGWGNDKYDWVFMPSTAGSGGASASTTVGDYFYKTANLNGYRAARLGGRWTDSSGAGVFYWALTHATSDRNRTIGARLMYIPS